MGSTGHSTVAGVILAAGSSRRLGGKISKQLLEIEGQPMIRRIAERSLASRLSEVAVVLGHRGSAVRRALTGLDLTMVENPDYRRGQSTSLRAGLGGLGSNLSAALFIPCDMPFLSAQLLDDLIGAHERTGGPIVVPVFDGRRGSPVLFHRSLFPELLQIEGDVGGRAILAQHAEKIIEVELDSAEPLLDIDTWNDYLGVSS